MFLTGSKVGLGTPWRRIRDLFGPPLGLESCWGFAVSHASSTPCSRGPEVQANRGRSCHSLAVHCTVNFFFIWAPFRTHGRDTKVRHELSPGPSVFNGFEGRVRHTLASHSGPFWATSWAWILLGFRCFACIVHSMFSGPWSSSQPRPKLPFTCRPLHG